MGKNYDLGTDKLSVLAVKLSIPTALAQAINVLYAIVDRMFIGHIQISGDIALAGVGIAAPITTLVSSFAVLVGLGGAPIMAMKEGHGEHGEAERIVSTGFSLLLVLSAILMPIVLLLKEQLLMAFGASDATLSYASEYLGWYIAGTPFALLATGLNSFIINQGLSKQAMFSVLAGAVLNIALDPIFIFTLDLGVKGGAIATVISQGASAAITIAILLSKKTTIRLRIGKPSPSLSKKIMKLGFSPFIIIGTDSILMILLNAVLQSYGGPGYGDKLITASTIIQSYHLLVMNPLGGITGGCQGLVSFNYGAGNSKRVRSAIVYVQIIAISYAVIMTIITLTCAKAFSGLFVSSEELIELTAHRMMIFESLIIPLSFQYNNVDMFTALGQVRFSLPLSLTRKFVFFAALAILPVFFGVDAAFLSEPISDIVSGILSTTLMWTMLPKILAKRESEGLRI